MISRRDMLRTGAAAGAALLLPREGFAQAPVFAPKPGKWRDFEVVTRLDLAGQGKTQAWIPLPSVAAAGWIKPGRNEWQTNAASAEIVSEPKYGAQMLHLVFKEGEAAPAVEVRSRFSLRDRAEDFAKGAAPTLGAAERSLYLEATELMPTDGIVRETAEKAAAGQASDIDKARAIYRWVVANTFRDAKTRGCGTGDVASMLRSGNLGGKCADLNALYVALVRALGIPARDIYGIRVAPSQFGYKSLGAGSEVITKAQHCRAEIWLEGHGWVATDPADVRKVALEEPPGNNAVDDPKVVAAREALFGAWEGNWLGYNMAHDLVLPGSQHKVGFLMYPQAEVAGALLDCLDPDTFRYTIKAAEITA
ncbi:transglutaminase [Bosea thiooxidans]|uniref:Transglutaminase n=1 Tax=Bosea thiooxidans TaxID=53254 RepID=A0A0Q3L6Z1_9HYPH|nr:transglutaminase domain-containing protein [Bosea thiooxidans]KQK32500.1 transglutaminase [Bosea thiooxidans]SKC10651.1 Transglutaminase-like enzyme, putative cysteine protease [Bosea thiooxidans]